MIPREIERKFLVTSDVFKDLATGKKHIRQAYLDFGPDPVVRVRQRDDKFFLTVKTPAGKGHLIRNEWEKEIDRRDAEILFGMAKGHVIEKIRYEIPLDDLVIEVDEFISPRKGLKLAEIEFKDAENALATDNLPAWVGKEVTDDVRYLNAYMAQHG